MFIVWLEEDETVMLVERDTKLIDASWKEDIQIRERYKIDSEAIIKSIRDRIMNGFIARSPSGRGFDTMWKFKMQYTPIKYTTPVLRKSPINLNKIITRLLKVHTFRTPLAAYQSNPITNKPNRLSQTNTKVYAS